MSDKITEINIPVLYNIRAVVIPNEFDSTVKVQVFERNALVHEFSGTKEEARNDVAIFLSSKYTVLSRTLTSLISGYEHETG